MGAAAESSKLLILTGPTAVGKTRLSIALAQALSGEIISADSMQVYRRMDIGTDKIRPDEMQGVPHHLIDILEPTEEFNVCLFEQLALKAIGQIRDRGHLPILVGGTGFYIQSVLYHVDFTEMSDGGAYRRSLMERIRQGSEEELRKLHDELGAVDPDAAATIHANNAKRVIRALEYYHLTGERISRHNEEQRSKAPAFDALYFVLTDDRERLYARINARVDVMVDRGLEDEVRGLLGDGLT